MKVTALLTGRGNNTLKDKNVLDILGHPVIYYPAHAAKKADIKLKLLYKKRYRIIKMWLKTIGRKTKRKGRGNGINTEAMVL